MLTLPSLPVIGSKEDNFIIELIDLSPGQDPRALQLQLFAGEIASDRDSEVVSDYDVDKKCVSEDPNTRPRPTAAARLTEGDACCRRCTVAAGLGCRCWTATDSS